MHNADKQDIHLIRTLLQSKGLQFEPYSKAVMKQQGKKTPDGKIIKGKQELSLLEVKSLYPTSEEEFSELLGQVPENVLLIGSRSDSAFNKISRHIRNAAEQFISVDPNHLLPHLVSIICYDPHLSPGDFLTTMDGYFRSTEGLQPFDFRAAKGVAPARSHIDGYIWIRFDSHGNSKMHYAMEPDSIYKEEVGNLLRLITAPPASVPTKSYTVGTATPV